MIKSSIILAVMFAYINILGYILHIFIARKLGPVEYGEFMVVYSLMLSIGFLSSTYSTITIKSILNQDKIRYDIFRYLRLISFITGLFFLFITVLLSGYLSDFLRIHREHIIPVGLVLLVMFSASVEKSFLQATEKFGLYAISNSSELTLRFVFAIFSLYVGYKIGGLILASFFSILLILFFLYFKNGYIFGKVSKISLKTVLKLTVLIAPSGLLIYADDIFVRKIFDDHTAGLYASASIVGKGLTWFYMTIFSVFFIRIIKNVIEYKKLLFKFFSFVLILSLIVEFLILVIGEPIFIYLFGQNYKNALPIFKIYIPLNIPLILNIAMVSANIGVEKFTGLIYLHIFTYYLGFLLVHFQTPYDYLMYICSANIFFMVLYMFKMFKTS